MDPFPIQARFRLPLQHLPLPLGQGYSPDMTRDIPMPLGLLRIIPLQRVQFILTGRDLERPPVEHSPEPTVPFLLGAGLRGPDIRAEGHHLYL
jgi:hypothetical protein